MSSVSRESENQTRMGLTVTHSRLGLDTLVSLKSKTRWMVKPDLGQVGQTKTIHDFYDPSAVATDLRKVQGVPALRMSQVEYTAGNFSTPCHKFGVREAPVVVS